MAPFNLGRSVSTHSPYHGRLREGRAGIKIEVVCKEVGSGVGCVYVLDGPDAKPVWSAERADLSNSCGARTGSTDTSFITSQTPPKGTAPAAYLAYRPRTLIYSDSREF